ncbi:MAG: outer membrane beta-barrel protein, partial [Brevundimonas sp.]|uniref:outer membrane beta-barrel protein n=1 Tax=Brevundimonas sp. TaxID=1871086 RepID=UPI0017F46A2D
MRVKSLILASSAAGALALSAGAASAEPNGWYGAIDAGWHTSDVETARGVDFETQDGWAAFARLGYRFNDNWRVELEGGHRAGGDIESVTLGSGAAYACNLTPSTGPCEAPEGDITATTVMANVIYDFGDASWSLRPFIGLGAGVNRVNTEFLGTFASARTISVGAQADERAQAPR